MCEVLMIEELGRSFTAAEAAKMLGLPKHQLVTNPGKFGGVRISQKRTVFYEKLIAEAIRRMHADQTQGQARQGGLVRTDHIDDAGRVEAAEREVIHIEEGRVGLGGKNGSRRITSRHNLW
jgi:hypothetical protein